MTILEFLLCLFLFVKERQLKREKEIEDLRNQLNELTQRFQNTQISIKQLSAQKEQVLSLV